MAEAQAVNTPSIFEQYLLKGKEEKQDVGPKSSEVKEAEIPVSAAYEEVASQKTEEMPAAVAEESTQFTSAVTEGSSAASPATDGNSIEPAPAAEEGSESTEEETPGNQEAAEETPEIKLETAPGDFRFPTTNQTRHCFTRYIEYHRCTAAKGEGAPECDKFAKYYRSLCPGEWVERWNEQRENGTFPGPL
ncbi:cytochrome c oxidase subunit 6b-1-like isoform X2 [Tripterygium wilfordii]|uniref:cytochrome c oxidase subunit 6b-1-like isoform X2 n=1 Tax=Tripterygium wilfordii TaxID=458696 RepID=UPI0018F8364E|nr:cytochrome c oxidase subunit 6b-1-like isoform X2 [Tripterygium wilfordii]